MTEENFKKIKQGLEDAINGDYAVVKPKQIRGFAAMSPEKRREIAAKGGANTPAHKRAYSMNRELAIEAGRKGGLANRKEKDQ